MNTLQPSITCIGTSDIKELTSRIATKLGILLQQDIDTQLIDYDFFYNGESKVELAKSVRGQHVYIINDVNSNSLITQDNISIQPSFNDRKALGELLVDTAYKYGAKEVSIVTTCFPYARQDKPNYLGNKSNTSRKPGAARLVAKTYESLGVTNCITLDLHNSAIGENFDNVNFVDLGIGWMFEEVMKHEQLDRNNIILSGTDEGSYKKISELGKDFQLPTTITFKKRDYSQSSHIDEIIVFGDITGKDIILYDDMIDTGGTFAKVVEAIHTHHPKSITALTTHGMFNKNAYELINDLLQKHIITNIYTTNSIYRRHTPDYMHIIDTSTIFSHTIAAIEQDQSIHYNNNTTV